MGASRIIHTRDTFPLYATTLGGAKRLGGEFRAHCEKCGAWQAIDLDKLLAIKGPDYSLIDRRCRCKLTPNCKGWNRFSYAAGNVFRPLVTDEARARWFSETR